MELKNVKISVDNIKELLINNEEEVIAIMRPALCQVRDSEGYDANDKKRELLKAGALNGDKFNAFRPSCFGKISYGHLSTTLKEFGYQVSQKGNCISDEKTATIPFERLQELEAIVKRYSNETNNNVSEEDKIMGLNTRQKISLAFGEYANQVNDLTQASLRFDSEFLIISNQLVSDMKGFDKGFLLSYILAEGLKSIGYSSKNVTQETRDAFYSTKKKKRE